MGAPLSAVCLSPMRGARKVMILMIDNAHETRKYRTPKTREPQGSREQGQAGA
jgi:hypothetical protein